MSETATGEPINWAAFYAEHGALMRRAAKSVLGKSATSDGATLGVSVDDVVHQVMADLMEKGLPAGVRSIRGFLYRRIESRAKDARKRGVHQPELPEGADNTDGTNVALEVEFRLESAAIVDALDELSERHRFVVIERVMKNRPAKEVAADLGIEPQGLPSLQRTAIDQLRANTDLMLSLDQPPADHDTDRSGTSP